MTTTNGPDTEPLWLAIEKTISGLGSQELAVDKLETVIQEVAKSMDAAGVSVSQNAGNMMDLRRALAARAAVGRPMMEDLNKAFDSLTLEKVSSPYSTCVELINEVGGDWPALKEAERRPHILRIVEKIKLDLLVAKAEEAGGDAGIRLLIEEGLVPEIIVDRMGTTQEEYARVLAAVEAERAERARVAELIADAGGKSEADLIRHLITSDVAEDLIIELAGVEPAAIDGVNKAMAEEIAEKERLAAEAAAKKAAEAAGPSLDDIPPDEMLEHIEAIREILDFSDKESEIRTMCEQSSIPKDLIEIAVSDPDRLDELEETAEG